MNKAQSELFDSLLDYWQKVVNELTDSIEDNYKMSSGLTAESIGELNSQPIELTSQGFKVTISMPPYYQFMDEGVSGAKFNKNISRFKYKDKGKGKGGRGQKGIPNITAIIGFMDNRGIKSFDDITPKRAFNARNTKSGKKKDAQEIKRNVAFAIAYNIWKYGQEPTNFYSDVINDEQIVKLERKLLAQYQQYVIDIIRIK